MGFISVQPSSASPNNARFVDSQTRIGELTPRGVVVTLFLSSISETKKAGYEAPKKARQSFQVRLREKETNTGCFSGEIENVQELFICLPVGMNTTTCMFLNHHFLYLCIQKSINLRTVMKHNIHCSSNGFRRYITQHPALSRRSEVIAWRRRICHVKIWNCCWIVYHEIIGS